MSSCSSSLPAARSLLGSTCSPSVTQLSSMLDAAAEQMMIHKDFRAAFDACDSGLESLAGLDEEEHRWSSVTGRTLKLCKQSGRQMTAFFSPLCFGDSFGELKAGFCILGIQALAEMNEWPAVLPWVLQQYEQERIPAKLMQMWWADFDKLVELPVQVSIIQISALQINVHMIFVVVVVVVKPLDLYNQTHTFLWQHPALLQSRGARDGAGNGEGLVALSTQQRGDRLQDGGWALPAARPGPPGTQRRGCRADCRGGRQLCLHRGPEADGTGCRGGERATESRS